MSTGLKNLLQEISNENTGKVDEKKIGVTVNNEISYINESVILLVDTENEVKKEETVKESEKF